MTTESWGVLMGRHFTAWGADNEIGLCSYVGWVERSDTQQKNMLKSKQWVSLRSTHPTALTRPTRLTLMHSYLGVHHVQKNMLGVAALLQELAVPSLNDRQMSRTIRSASQKDIFLQFAF